ncbi:MAG: hypothetical protein EAZ95_00705 [Bacteroidetes bacterium]|nr:MAG: hypothetical protein EAZ95_00705 [Bacteroidota bacterium]
MRMKISLFPSLLLACLLFLAGVGKEGYAQSKIIGSVFNEKAEPIGEVLISVAGGDYIKTLRNGSFQVLPKVAKPKYEVTDFNIKGYRVKRLEGNNPFNVHVTPATQLKGKVIDKLKRNKKFTVTLQDENETEGTMTQADGFFQLNNISLSLLSDATHNLKFWVDNVLVDAKHIRFEHHNTVVYIFVPNDEKFEPDIDLSYEEAKIPEEKLTEPKEEPNKEDFLAEFSKITANLLDDRQEQQKRAKRLKTEVANLTEKLRNAKNIPAKEREDLIRYMTLMEDTFSDNDSLFSIYQAESKAEIAKMQRIIQQKDSLRNVAENKTKQVEQEKDRIEAEKKYNELQFQTRIFIFSIIVVVLVALVFLFFFYNRIIKRQRDQLQIIGNKLAEKVEEVNQQKEEILTQRDDLEQKSKQLEYAYGQMTSSIVSAERIQNAILDSPKELLARFADGFVLYYPRDIVSGDFYWCTQKDENILVGVIDCTGHGVPGAFMTMLGHSLLNYIINDQGVTHPNEVLTLLDKQVHQSLHQNSREDNYVGMDMALLCLDYKQKLVHFAGAKHYILRMSQGELTELKGAKFPIGITRFTKNGNFEEQTFPLVSGDCFYFQSDGLTDQIAEIEGKRKKFTKKRYLDFILAHYELPFAKQQKALEEDFATWKGDNMQTDDITVVGIKIT